MQVVCKVAADGSDPPATEDSITVKIIGTLRTRIVAIGGETTGTTITAKNITWELDFGQKAQFRKAAETLDGKKVVVEGSLEKRRGVEIKERWIVHVSDLKAVGDGVGVSENGARTTDPAQVQARAFVGTDPEPQNRGDIEPWISKSVATTATASVQPHSNWIVLTGEFERLYTSMQGGFIIDGKVSKQNKNHQVEIYGCDGGPVQKTVRLRPGERRVVKLTNKPAPNNVFIALEAPISEKPKKRAEALKADSKNFRLELNYHGEQGKPFYQLIVSVPPVDSYRSKPFHRIMFVKEHEASNIIDHLARDGFLDHAVDLRTSKIPPPTMPGYTAKVVTGDMMLYEDFGWGLPMIHRLDALRDVLPDDGKKEMDLLLGRRSGLRKQWEAQQPPFDAEVGRKDSQVRFVAEGDTTIIDITSKFGIDKATIKRESPKWPKSILVRLHLGGLEFFNVNNGAFVIEWSAANSGDHSSRVFQRLGGEETELDPKSPYHTPVRIVGGNGKIPLKDGYFEVSLPAKLFERNPEEITLEWIDFYRN